MTTTTQQRQTIKDYADKHDMRYRITAGGEVHMHGEMPNTNQTGWYLFAQSPSAAVETIDGPTY